MPFELDSEGTPVISSEWDAGLIEEVCHYEHVHTHIRDHAIFQLCTVYEGVRVGQVHLNILFVLITKASILLCAKR